MTMESSYKEQHGTWLKNREKERKKFEKEQDALRRQHNRQNPGDEPPVQDSPAKDRRHRAEAKEPLQKQQREEQIQKQLQEEHARKKHRKTIVQQPHEPITQSADNGPAWTWSANDNNFVPYEQYRASPPALTDTSLPTPAAGDSGVSTPIALPNGSREGTKRKPVLIDDDYEIREGKRARVSEPWQMDKDPLLGDFTVHRSKKQGQQRKARHSHHP
jgi:hypothetical protein